MPWFYGDGGFALTSRFAAVAATWILWRPLLAQAASPLNYLQSSGSKADHVLPLMWAVLVISIVVIVVIGALLGGAIWHRPGMIAAPAQRLPVIQETSGLNWLWIGVGISTLALLFTIVWTVKVLAAIAAPPMPPPLTIEVTGRQWWWQVRYLDPNASHSFTTANEIHIPVGTPVQFRLIGGDVIHSFWIPRLTGKTDLIPGQTNELWLDAKSPGIYRGQCTEYCGLEHAKMQMLVIADTPADFAAWRAHQEQSPAMPTGIASTGHTAFGTYCGSCHAVRGTEAAGVLGPDLSHLMQRRTLAAGILPNTHDNRWAWIADPQAIKPGNLMQRPELSAQELVSIRAYLETLN
ncbi:MAG TPA: cytochrome c oxidase subunit II [Rhizomicrobium sp.]|nr:cytochrome c oxidase subunit II [Rhizomicrobium sp.]